MMTNQQSVFRSRSMVFISLLLAAATLLFVCRVPDAGAASQKTASQKLFSSPEDALKALVEAVKTKDKTALDLIFGPAAKELRSSDEVQAAAESDEFAKHLAEKTDLVKETDSKVVLHVGNENWPFPIPIVKNDGRWFFDTEAGKEEILNRRIG